VYEKTLFGTSASSVGNSVRLPIGFEIDKLVSLYAQIEANDPTWDAYHRVGSDISSCGVTYDKSNVTVFTNNVKAASKPIQVTIQYTKTTDNYQ
jgi:hypothetical protein